MAIQYRFSGFILSPSRRVLLKEGREVEIIPRYFDLLLLLLERRHEAVHRREIHEAVWRDVVVSDGALSQAVRTLRRALGDDPREPIFIRTIQRHGYRFVWADVEEEPDGGGSAEAAPAPAPASPAAGQGEEAIERAIERLLSESGAAERREAAEQLHALGTERALRVLDQRPGHERARALLRDARWDVPGAGPVPILGRPGGVRTMASVVGLRLRRAARLAGLRWGAAAAGGALAGLAAGLAGGAVLRAGPGSAAGSQLPLLLGLIGAVIGGLGAAGVGAGLAAAEAVARSARGAALVIFGAAGGGAIGAAAHLVALWVVRGVFGHELPAVGGGFEGILLGGAAGLGYAISTPRPEGGGMAAPRGGRRFATAAVTGLCCAAAAVIVNQAGGSLGGVSLDFLARSFEGSQVGLAPLARLLGEEAPGPVTRMVLGLYEGFLFGFGLAIGLTRRPAPPP